MANEWVCLAVAIHGTFSGFSFHWKGRWISFAAGFDRVPDSAASSNRFSISRCPDSDEAASSGFLLTVEE